MSEIRSELRAMLRSEVNREGYVEYSRLVVRGVSVQDLPQRQADGLVSREWFEQKGGMRGLSELLTQVRREQSVDQHKVGKDTGEESSDLDVASGRHGQVPLRLECSE